MSEIVVKSKNCIECISNNITNKAILHTKLKLILCSQCRQLDKYTLITKTKSKTEYLLNDEDLIGLESISAKIPYGMATYYKKLDLIVKACSKFNTTPNELTITISNIKNDKDYKKEERKKKRIEKETINKNIRKDELILALQNAGLELRSDSVLCQTYIDGKCDGKKNSNSNSNNNNNNTSIDTSIDTTIDTTIEKIVKRMCQIKYLYEYCHMEECKDIAYEEYNNELKAGYYSDFSVSESAEYMALKKYSKSVYPNVFPWKI